ncbi:MAG: AmmeMemoRadiSam system radical SAM enzyme [Candidatus Micrarchaeia archaeon]|jgi:pyruvate formate lyase activating enzyme
MQKASLFSKSGKNIVTCTACSRYCKISDQSTGFCGVRKNCGGELCLLAYGKPSSIAIDPVEKKPLFHFLPSTDVLSMGTYGCNFACEFCQNPELSQAPRLIGGASADAKKRQGLIEKEFEKLPYVSPADFACAAVENNCSSVAFTYNEPAIFSEYARDCAVAAKKEAILGTVYVSNGYESKESIEFIAPVLDAINIDIKSFSKKFYAQTCCSSLEPVLETVKRCRKLGIWMEITTLVIPGKNDSKEELQEIAAFIASTGKDVPWHVTAFHPAHKMQDAVPTPSQALIDARKIGIDAGLNYVYVGNLPSKFADYESTHCPKCGELLVRRVGYAVDAIGLEKGKCRECSHRIAGIWEKSQLKKLTLDAKQKQAKPRGKEQHGKHL